MLTSSKLHGMADQDKLKERTGYSHLINLLDSHLIGYWSDFARFPKGTLRKLGFRVDFAREPLNWISN